MKIINCMFGRGLGGIEQSFLDHCTALIDRGHSVSAIIHPKAKILPKLDELKIPYFIVNSFGQYDFFAYFRLKKLLKMASPDAIVTHGNRAATLINKAVKGKYPIVSVAHNYRFKRLLSSDHIMAITPSLLEAIKNTGYSEEKLHLIPNMIRLEENYTLRPYNASDIPVIGTLGRLHHVKGMDILINALSILKKRNIPFRAIIGGEGKDRKYLENEIKKQSLEEYTEMLGWIEDKKSFFKEIDIFCLPSRSESFGIVMLEAFANSVPVITTNTEGPMDIVTPGEDSLIAKKEDPVSLADKIEELIKNKDLGDKLIKNAYKTALKYSMEKVGRNIEVELEKIIESTYD